MTDFVHLHCHTEYSTLDGINKIDTLPAYAKQIGMNAVAQTDHGNMVGAHAFYKECVKQDIKPVLGIEAYYSIEDRTVRAKDEHGQSYYHIVLLAKNKVGLKNLFKLSSLAYSTGYYSNPRCDDSLLMECSEGVIATSACLGSAASQAIMRGDKKQAEKMIQHHAEIFKDNFYIELQLHAGEQEEVNKELIQIAKRHKLPMILTNDCHYMESAHKGLHEQALCIATNSHMYDKTYEEGGSRFSFGDLDVHFASGDWMSRGANYYNLPSEVITNTVHISKQIDALSYFSDIINHYPKYPDLPEGMTADEALANFARNELLKKFKGNVPKVYKERLDYELKYIKMMGYSDYLLIQSDFIEMAKKNDIMVGLGRGSAAGSLVTYAIGITGVDPIEYDLFFERFLNIGRAAKVKTFSDAFKTAELKKIHNHETCSHKH